MDVLKFIFRWIARISLPAATRNWIRDSRETIRWHFAPSPKGSKSLGLVSTQFYPAGIHFQTVVEEVARKKLRNLEIGKGTALVSLGSCFAEEFAREFQRRGYKYIVNETVPYQSCAIASANWGRVYTAANFHQIVEYSFDSSFPLYIQKNDSGYYDLTRERSVGHFETEEAAALAIKSHRVASKKTFQGAEVLVFTLGQNEAWVNSDTGLIYAEAARRDGQVSMSETVRPISFSITENLDFISKAIIKLLVNNPKLKIILTLSPVPAYAIFNDTDAVSASFLSKCSLRVVIDQVLKRFPDNIYYFPSFEIVLGINRDALCADNRHVRSTRVKMIFDSFFSSIAT